MVAKSIAAVVVELGGRRTGTLGAARAASCAASLAASLVSYKGSTISLRIARSLFSLFDLNDFAIFVLLLFRFWEALGFWVFKDSGLALQ